MASRGRSGAHIDMGWLYDYLNQEDINRTGFDTTAGRFTGGKDAGRRNADMQSADYARKQESDQRLKQQKELSDHQLRNEKALRDDEQQRKIQSRKDDLTQTGANTLRALRSQGKSFSDINQMVGTDNIEQIGSMYPFLFGNFADKGAIAGVPSAQLAGIEAANRIQEQQAYSPYAGQVGANMAQSRLLDSQSGVNTSQIGADTTASQPFRDSYQQGVIAKNLQPVQDYYNSQRIDASPMQLSYLPEQRNLMTGNIQQPAREVRGAQTEESVYTPTQTIGGQTFQGDPVRTSRVIPASIRSIPQTISGDAIRNAGQQAVDPFAKYRMFEQQSGYTNNVMGQGNPTTRPAPTEQQQFQQMLDSRIRQQDTPTDEEYLMGEMLRRATTASPYQRTVRNY